MKYKNLFFDLDDTIWAFSQNARDTFEEVYQKYSYERYLIRSIIFMQFIKREILNSGLNMVKERSRKMN